MGNKIVEFIGERFLAVSVLCGPWLWLLALACAFAAWRPGLGGVVVLGLFFASFVFMYWALWGILSGPCHLRFWWFGLSSLVNLGIGFWIVVSEEPYPELIGVLCLGYSLWQFFVFRRLRTHVVS